jgi:uncharacterized protein (TIGR01777 family)
MNILITGASGLVGSHLAQALSQRGDQLVLVGRNKSRLEKMAIENAQVVTWDELNADLIKQQDVIVNLAGENIGAKKWSQQQKQKILQSRVDTTKQVADLCASLGKHAPKLIQASAIGVYGSQFPRMSSEDSATENDITEVNHQNFLSHVATAWESALESAVIAEVPIVITRFAVILDSKQGALAKMLPSFRFGGGAVISDGSQPFPWVLIDDVINALLYFIEHVDITGTYNIVADEAVSQRTFAKTLAKTLNRPCLLMLPPFIVKTLFGEMGERLLLEGCKVSNQKIKQAGFSFSHPELAPALTYLLKK